MEEDLKKQIILVAFASLILAGCVSNNPNRDEAKTLTIRCSDGTPSGLCSTTKPLYCVNDALVSNPNVCGCPEGQESNSNETCSTNNTTSAGGETKEKSEITCPPNARSFKVGLDYTAEWENLSEKQPSTLTAAWNQGFGGEWEQGFGESIISPYSSKLSDVNSGCQGWGVLKGIVACYKGSREGQNIHEYYCCPVLLEKHKISDNGTILPTERMTLSLVLKIGLFEYRTKEDYTLNASIVSLQCEPYS